MPQDEVEAMVEQLRDTTCNERSPCFALYNDEAAALLTRLSAQLEAWESDDVARHCRDCTATVAVHPEGMSCHCRTMHWIVPAGSAQEEQGR